MPKTARVISRFTKKEIEHAFCQARKIFSAATFTILQAPKQTMLGRILIITQRKIGNAPQRNKIKRQIKSIFYQARCYEQNYDYIIIVKKPALELPFEKIKQTLLHSINKYAHEVV